MLGSWGIDSGTVFALPIFLIFLPVNSGELSMKTVRCIKGTRQYSYRSMCINDKHRELMVVAMIWFSNAVGLMMALDSIPGPM